MKNNLIALATFILCITAGLVWLYFLPASKPKVVNTNPRQFEQLSLNTKGTQARSVSATKLPEFTYDIADPKFKDILSAASDKLTSLVKATIAHDVYAATSIPTEVSVDKDKHQLVVSPQDIPNFKPGKYHLSLQLRTLEGTVNIDQDFTWGVIAVNTNKSIYCC